MIHTTNATEAGSFTRSESRTVFDLAAWQVQDEIRVQFRRVAAVLGSIKGESFAVAVCSTAPDEGVTWVTGMLACAVAENGRQVAVADTANGPGLSRLLGAEANGQAIPRPSLTDFRTYQSGAANISIVAPANPSQAAADVWVGAVTALRSFAPAVLVDCGSLEKSPKLFHLSAALDGVVLVVEAERERRDAVAATLATLRSAGIPVLGVILNKRRQHAPSLIQKRF